ncbi:MAG: hypothetical protein SGBAC_001176 [Bacillariaceae sp.]
MIVPTPATSSSCIVVLKDSDIVCGRGGLANKHPGNRLLRRICNENRELYQCSMNPVYKQCLILSIFTAIQQNGGSFLTRTKDGSWQEISDKKAKEKTAQLLRENESTAMKPMAATSHTKAAVKNDDSFLDAGCNDCHPIIQAPLTKRPSRITPETAATKDLYSPDILPSDDLANLLQQPLLLEPDEVPSTFSAPPALVFEHGDNTFDRIALETGETREGNMEYSRDFRPRSQGWVPAYNSVMC